MHNGNVGSPDSRLLVYDWGNRNRIEQQMADETGLVERMKQSRTVGEIIRSLEVVWSVLEPDGMYSRLAFTIKLPPVALRQFPALLYNTLYRTSFGIGTGKRSP